MSRPLRVMLVANDGFSVGHIVRTIAITRALREQGKARSTRSSGSIELRFLFATTSEAHSLLANEPLAILRLPAPDAARAAGFTDDERRRVIRGTLEGAARAFAPDLLVVDTFPSGPHHEFGGAFPRLAPKRALVRRAVIDAANPVLTTGLEEYQVAILIDDVTPLDDQLPIPTKNVPPIILEGTPLDRAAAREQLRLPPDGKIYLVAIGGGGDHIAMLQAVAVAQHLSTAGHTVALALGPLMRGVPPGLVFGPAGIIPLNVSPLEPFLAAFDGAFTAAGYNTAHELAHAGIPAVLLPQKRYFDDQGARAERLANAGYAKVLASANPKLVIEALAWIEQAKVPKLKANGAARAADILLDLACGVGK